MKDRDQPEFTRTEFAHRSELPAPEPDYHQDQILGGKYRVISLLGRGGMGVVYRVEQILIGKQLALKTIKKSDLSDFTLRRFQTEARVTFALNHPNIVSVHDFGLLDDQTPFLAMEIVNGEALSSLLRQRTLTIDEALEIFIQVCFGLAHAHENGVVHRDVKPSNIMLLNAISWSTEGSVKILDFGIAKLTQHEGGEIQALTKTGEIFGSPFYMSPEQCTGEKVDLRSDVYSLGCVLFEALTGTPPFVGESALNTMMMHQSNSLPSLKEASLGAEFPVDLDRIISKMLAKDPAQRYQNLGLAAHDLAAVKRGETDSLSLAPSPVEKEKSSNMVTMKRSNYILLLASLALLSSLSTAIIMQRFLAKPAPVVTPPTTAPDYPLSDKSMTKNLFLDKVKQGYCSFDSEGLATDENLKDLANYDGAQRVQLGNSSVTDAGIANLKKSKVLGLDLSLCKGINSVDNISQLKYLQALDLTETNIDDKCIKPLAKLPMLRELNLKRCKLSAASLDDLAESTSLKKVELPERQYSQEVIARLQDKLPDCDFPGYTDSSKLFRMQVALDKESPLLRTQKLYAVSSKANPSSTSTVTYMLTMTDLAPNTSKMNSLTARKKAMQICETNGNMQNMALITQEAADLELQFHHIDEANRLNEKASKLFFDTLYHDQELILQTLERSANIPGECNRLEKAIEFSKKGLSLAEQFKSTRYIQVFEERIGWLYYRLGKLAEAVPYLQRNLADSRKAVDGNLQYARALIELGHCLPEISERKKVYNEGLQAIETLGFPAQYNLQEHYCDGCSAMVNILLSESKPNEALGYSRRALTAAEGIKADIFNRKKFFRDQIDGINKIIKKSS